MTNTAVRRGWPWVAAVGLLVGLAVGVVLGLSIAGGFSPAAPPPPKTSDEASEKAKHLIAAPDIQFVDMQFSYHEGAQEEDGSQGPDRGWILEGSVRNKSHYPLKAFSLKVFVEKCPGETAESCDVTADGVATVDKGVVPVDQLRQFSAGVKLDGDADPNSSPKWRYEVRELVAQVEQQATTSPPGGTAARDTLQLERWGGLAAVLHRKARAWGYRGGKVSPPTSRRWPVRWVPPNSNGSQLAALCTSIRESWGKG
jgi:hypothetical protein